ncbi:MAG: hypothetical protein D6718_10010 [Acidobacteria bacterium]|nr:MAG: hypothetical protein D6718_10010 [Acidobacteriota bacterium]
MGMREVLPRVFHWTAVHPRIGVPVSSYFVADHGLLIDPMQPPEGAEALRELGEPKQILLTNRHHRRDAEALAETFGIPVWCEGRGCADLGGLPGLRPFSAGEDLPFGVATHAVGTPHADETAFLLSGEPPVLVLGDCIVRMGDGPLGFVPDRHLGPDPETVKRELRRAVSTLLPLHFDHLLLAHGNPWIGGAHEALTEFIASEC